MEKFRCTLSPLAAIQIKRGGERKRWLREGWVKAEKEADRQTGHAIQLPHSFNMHQALLNFPTTQSPTVIVGDWVVGKPTRVGRCAEVTWWQCNVGFFGSGQAHRLSVCPFVLSQNYRLAGDSVSQWAHIHSHESVRRTLTKQVGFKEKPFQRIARLYHECTPVEFQRISTIVKNMPRSQRSVWPCFFRMTSP